MLPSVHRMRRSSDFAATVRTGRRVGGPVVVVHHSRSVDVRSVDAPSVADLPALVGLVVGKAVGNSVVRHRVSRRLRAQLAQRLIQLPAGSATVIRALPAAGSATSVELGAQLDRALAKMAGPR